MGKLILVRHGQTDMNKERLYYGRLDVPINETGREQAREARKNLINFKIDYDQIYSSDLKRAYETAQIINYKNLDIKIDTRIKEMDFGIFEGLSSEEIKKIYPEQMEKARKNWKTYSYENGESPYIMQERVIDFFETIDKSKNTLIATHWGIITSLLSHLFSFGLLSYRKFEVKNGGIIIIDFVNNKYPVLSAFNIGG